MNTDNLQSQYASLTTTTSGRRLTSGSASGWFDRVAANLLLQATHGPTPSSLRNLSLALQASASGAITHTPAALTAWVHDQLAMQPTLHRAYYRERVNPRLHVPITVGNPRSTLLAALLLAVLLLAALLLAAFLADVIGAVVRRGM